MLLLLEKPQGRLHPGRAELLLSGRDSKERAGKEMRGLLLCENTALCQRLLLKGTGQVATGKQRDARGEGQGAK